MSQQKQLITLRLPAMTASTDKLSFCRPDAESMAAWLRELPRANVAEYSRLLYQALAELGTLEATPQLRLQLLELLRPEITLILNQLEKNHLLTAVILDARANRIASLCQALQNHLNTGYKQVIVELQHKKSSQLLLAMQRALQGLLATLTRTHLIYRPVPANLWFKAHQLYQLACHHQLQRQKVRDPLLDCNQTIEQAYCCLLLLGCSRPNQMRQPDIQALGKNLPYWSTFARLQDIDATGSLFAIALATDTPPRYKSLLSLTGRNDLLGLNTAGVIAALQQDETAATWPASRRRKKSAPPPLIPEALREQLISAWGDIAKRDFNRNPAGGRLELCLGMSAAHFHVSGQLAFEDTLIPPSQEPAQVPAAGNDSHTDVWDRAADAYPERSAVRPEPVDYRNTREEHNDHSPGTANLYPMLDVAIVNQSPGGYCVEWPNNAPANLQTGDIVALRTEPGRDWSIATIRWIRQNTRSGAQAGIELLAGQAEPCGIQLLRSGKAASSLLRALHVPGSATRPAQIITTRLPFHEGCSVILNLHGEESRAVLNRLLKQTACCAQFEYEQAPQRPSGNKVQSSGKDNPAVFQPPSTANEHHAVWNLL